MLPLPLKITLPGGRRYERYAYLFWRVRIPLWVVPAALGWLVLSWPGIAAGLAAGTVAELFLSYRPAGGQARPKVTPGPGWGPGGSAGVREPRRPYPTGGADAARIPSSPTSPRLD